MGTAGGPRPGGRSLKKCSLSPPSSRGAKWSTRVVRGEKQKSWVLARGEGLWVFVAPGRGDFTFPLGGQERPRTARSRANAGARQPARHAQQRVRRSWWDEHEHGAGDSRGRGRWEAGAASGGGERLSCGCEEATVGAHVADGAREATAAGPSGSARGCPRGNEGLPNSAGRAWTAPLPCSLACSGVVPAASGAEILAGCAPARCRHRWTAALAPSLRTTTSSTGSAPSTGQTGRRATGSCPPRPRPRSAQGAGASV